MGYVTGGGTYAENSVIELKAFSNPGYHFVQWNDYTTDSIRTVTVTNDMNFTAFFASNVGIDEVNANAIALYPNPASSTVTLTGISGEVEVMVADMNGREVIRTNATTLDVSGLAKGAYFVRITTAQAQAIRKLIVK